MKNVLSKVSLDSLVHFHYVCLFQSLGKAAEHLHLSAPAVSHSLNKLEASLGVVLCHRSRMVFRLTNEGQRLFEKCQVIVSQLEGLDEDTVKPEEFAGTLTVALDDNFENEKVQNAITVVTEKFPKMKLGVEVAPTEDIVAGLLSGEIDVGFSIFHNKTDRLKYFAVGEMTLRYFISKRHPLWSKKTIEKQDLYGHRVAWVESKRRNRHQLEAEIFVPHDGYKMMVQAYSNNLDGALTILKSGFAVVPLPPEYVERLAGRKDIREVKVQTKAPIFREEGAYNARIGHSAPARHLLAQFKTKGS
jgi:DNA-binding transcriptional LysR family regulator